VTPWNWAGVWAFAVAFPAARAREQADERWDLTLEDWLPTLGLTREQWEGMLLPWAASLYSGDIDEARTLSARAAMIFAAKALPPNPLAPVQYYVLNGGLAQPLQRMLAQCSTVRLLTGSPVERVAREARGGFTIRCHGRPPIVVDDLVFASSGPGTRALLGTMPGTEAQRQAIGGIEFRGARLALHTDPIYAPADTERQSFLNCRIQDGYCEASMHLDTIVTDAPPATAAKLWKSWVTHRATPPGEVLHETEYQHMLPSVATLQAQTAVGTLQGLDGVWFAGGYLHPYDAQESALRSALGVAAGLKVTTPRWHALAD
jgi:predicted NAD/FAD-binding protein